ncbi:MAG: thiamine-phosphate kinase [Methylacidiphilales bacterium]|nr:thiamine-phosphate kinase [Candidatus Methylacidiphilales bacterium]MDW8349225.1 thiamine-phosphate kinase [Verrucomicrobiae bacterium]
MKSYRDTGLSEISLIATLTRYWQQDASIVKGVGDDCAVLSVTSSGRSRYLLFKTDAIVEDVHFESSTSPRLVGRKAIARVLSDIAAMGGRPWVAVVTLGRPRGISTSRLKAVYAGMQAMADKVKLLLVGGETVTTRQLVLSVAALGWTQRVIGRAGAKSGDYVYVTGRLGGAMPRRHLTFSPRLAEGQWLARHGYPTAMMDISDGLGIDLIRLVLASNVGVRLDEKRIPRFPGVSLHEAMETGEDYELLFTVPKSKAKSLERKWPFSTPLSCIGEMRGRVSETLREWPWKGYDHLRGD